MIKTRKFDTNVQQRKYEVLREVARFAWNGTLDENVSKIPDIIMSSSEVPARRDDERERKILNQRIKIAMGGDKSNPNIIQVIDAACDKCPTDGYYVTDICRGCIAHRCERSCPRDAITFDQNHTAHIDKEKCVNCGQCAKACPYGAIANRKRPCENACKVSAISADENGTAAIDNSKCVSCGACSVQCPFGAIADKSYILDVIDLIKQSDSSKKYKVYAIFAPAISGQFSYAKLGQIVNGMKALGFYSAVEAALGADMVAISETKELVEKGFLTSSCCPAFVAYIKKQFPDLEKHISHNFSPSAAIAKYIKSNDPSAKTVFIGPCTAKKTEFQREDVRPYIDSAITFEELQALFDSRDLDIASMEEAVVDDASYYGRIFARSGGLAEAVVEAMDELKVEEFKLNPVICSGLDECRMELLKASKNCAQWNFIEGMACSGGCVNGAGCMTHSSKNKIEVDKFGKEAGDKSISESLEQMK